MTVAQTTPPLEFETLADAIAALRAQGLRMSAARRLVLETLFAAARPLSAEEVADGLDGLLPISDLASCYRNLETLERLGLVRHVHLGHSPGMYSLAGRGAPEYLHCEICGGYTIARAGELDAVREAVREAFGYAARFSHFPIVGTCPACLGPDTPAQSSQLSAMTPDADASASGSTSPPFGPSEKNVT
jgi:Fur family ferric uptake transcriptional regulator